MAAARLPPAGRRRDGRDEPPAAAPAPGLGGGRAGPHAAALEVGRVQLLDVECACIVAVVLLRVFVVLVLVVGWGLIGVNEQQPAPDGRRARNHGRTPPTTNQPQSNIQNQHMPPPGVPDPRPTQSINQLAQPTNQLPPKQNKPTGPPGALCGGGDRKRALARQRGQAPDRADPRSVL